MLYQGNDDYIKVMLNCQIRSLTLLCEILDVSLLAKPQEETRKMMEMTTVNKLSMILPVLCSLWNWADSFSVFRSCFMSSTTCLLAWAALQWSRKRLFTNQCSLLISHSYLARVNHDCYDVMRFQPKYQLQVHFFFSFIKLDIIAVFIMFWQLNNLCA